MKPFITYSEAAFFDGFHFAHIAAWLEHLRLKRVDIHIRRSRR